MGWPDPSPNHPFFRITAYPPAMPPPANGSALKPLGRFTGLLAEDLSLLRSWQVPPDRPLLCRGSRTWNLPTQHAEAFDETRPAS